MGKYTIEEPKYVERLPLARVQHDIQNQGLRVLIVDDEPAIIAALRVGLEHAGFEVRTAGLGSDAISMVTTWAPHVMVLDIMLPDMEGYEVCRQVRTNSNVLVLMLTVRDDIADKVQGFEVGADDYQTKPFELVELTARIRALLRRHTPTDDILVIDGITLNIHTREVRYHHNVVELTPREFDMLHFLMQHPNQVLTRQAIRDQIWGYDNDGDANAIEVYISYLRSKLDSKLIKTVRGVGYVLRSSADDTKP